jgi:broad specificity phosphatase PhoE
VSRYLYLVRHGEQLDAERGVDDGPLSERGKRQAALVADRLGGVPFDRAWTSPLQRAQETAEFITARMPGIEPSPTALLMDCIPTGKVDGTPSAFDAFFRGVRREEIEAGEAQMGDARDLWFARSPGADTRELLITHNFVIGWFVREALGAEAWRWLGLNQANCGLTIIRVRSTKPPELVVHNDLGHLPAELRTGLPSPQPW